MKKIGMVGSQLIHTYVYAMHFNRGELAFAKNAKTAPAWQVDIMQQYPDIEPLSGAEITHVRGGPEGVSEDLAGTFGMTVAQSLDEVLEQCDLIMVMDEDIPSRSDLVEKALKAGKDVFVDKLPSDKLEVTERLIALADEKGLALAGWSQMGFCPEYAALQQMPVGGVALIAFRMTPDILFKYGIHLISAMQGAFPGRVKPCGEIITNHDSTFIPLEHENGATILISCGPHYPAYPTAGVRVDYCVDGQSILIETTDYCGAFRSASESIVAILNGESPRFGTTELLEAAKVSELLFK